MDKILGVKVDNLKKEEILARVNEFLISNNFHQIATVNAEFILHAQKDIDFLNVLNACDLNVADTISIKYAFWRYGKNLKYRIAGIDLMLEILKIANEKKLKIFLATSKRGLSTFEETKSEINKLFPELIIEGRNLENCEPITVDCELVFCNFGAPEQEKFLNNLKSDKIKLAMGVGGSFDYLTRKLTRAPRWMQKIGLEWLWRLILQPKRFMRIFNATIIFPIKIIFSK